MRDAIAQRLALMPARLSWNAPGIWPTVLVGAAYYAGSLIGFGLRLPASGISFLWPPTAILTAALLLAPSRAWGGYLIAALIAHGFAHAGDGVPVGAWLLQFAANGVQALFGAFLVRRYTRRSPLFLDLHSVVVFIVGACIVAPAAASVIGALVYVRIGWAADFFFAWRARVLSNFIATITIVPPIVMTWQRFRSRADGASARRVLEFGVLLAALVATWYVAIDLPGQNLPGVRLPLYAPIPFLLWASLRFGPAELSGALLCTTLLTVSSAVRGTSPFVGGTPNDTTIAVQLFISMTVIPLMLIAGLIEETRRERRAVAESEQRTTAMLRAIPDLMFLQTRDGVYLSYHADNLRSLLVPPDAFVGKNMHDVLPPDLAAKLAVAFEEATRDVPSLVEYSLEIDGSLRHYEARVIAMDGNRVLSIVRDITGRARSEMALRESERRYALATASGGVGVWETDLTGGRLYVDPALKRALGYADDEIPNTAEGWAPLVHPPDLQMLTSRMLAHARGETDGIEIEHRMLHRDGSMRWFLTKGEMIERGSGAGMRIAGTSTDTTERKEAEIALKQAQAVLARMARMTALDELTVSIAHEVNQPLCAIVANANACLNWLENTAATDDLRAALGDIVHDGHRASVIIKRTRELFANQPALRKCVDLNAVVGEVLNIVRERLRSSGIHLEMWLDETLPPVAGDEVQLQQVMLNLVQNAIESMQSVDEGRRRLRVSSRSTGAHAVVTVRDNGPGLPSADVERVFDPFFTTKPDGIGIGLAISRSIVKAHGGLLWATANYQGGATFWFKLPATVEPHD